MHTHAWLLTDNFDVTYGLQKVPAGGIQEKLASAYRSVHDVVSDEDATLGRCNAAVIRVDGLEKEANTVRSSRGFFDLIYAHLDS